MATLPSSPESDSRTLVVPEVNAPVLQPGKAPGIESILDQIDAMRISETTGEDKSGDWSGSGGGAVATQGTAGTAISPRDQALKSLPSQQIMQKQIAKHIAVEIRQLRRCARKVTRIGRAGQAFELAKIYTRLRQLTSLMQQLWESSYDVVRRIFIRIFIDKQSVL